MSEKKIGYYVLWENRAGLKVWSGPYATITEASNSTAMRDKWAHAFVLHYAGPLIP